MRYNPPPTWPTPPTGWVPPPGWQPDPTWGPPPEGWQVWVEDKKRPWVARHKVLTAIGALVVFAIIGAVSNGGKSPATTAVDTSSAAVVATKPAAAPSSSSSSAPAPAPAAVTTTTQAPPPPAPKAAGIGSKVRDGSFEFTVRSVKCGIKSVGDPSGFVTQKAQGQFCRVAVKVQNIGTSAQSMFSGNQYAFDSGGRKFTSSTEAALYDQSSQLLFTDVNPGNNVEGNIYFDVPKGASLDHLELHDSAFSDGVSVSVG
jgi:hypothetical protein